MLLLNKLAYATLSGTLPKTLQEWTLTSEAVHFIALYNEEVKVISTCPDRFIPAVTPNLSRGKYPDEIVSIVTIGFKGNGSGSVYMSRIQFGGHFGIVG